MQFEFDQVKSDSNYQKHGIDFIIAQALWLDDFYLEVPAKSDDEPRFQVIGLIGDKHYSAFITYRDECIRIISVRHARKEEVAMYES